MAGRVVVGDFAGQVDPVDPTFYERLSKMTERSPSGCLLFVGTKCPKGYGYIKFRGKVWRTHRATWTAANGPVPAGMHLDHLCRTPSCCEVSHLEVVTPLENRRRQRDVVREVCARGHSYEGVRGSRGERRCQTCKRDWARRKRAEMKAAGIKRIRRKTAA